MLSDAGVAAESIGLSVTVLGIAELMLALCLLSSGGDVGRRGCVSG